MGPTPMTYFAHYHLKADAAVMVTGSHNPSEYNGFKMVFDKHSFFAEDIQNLQKIITLGGEKINEAATYSKKGLDYFNSQNYIKAASAFEKAIEINPLEYAHFENAATSNYLVGNLKKALNQIDVVIKDLNPLNGKCEYIKALILLRLGDTESACNFLKISKDSGFSKSTETLKQYCF